MFGFGSQRKAGPTPGDEPEKIAPTGRPGAAADAGASAIELNAAYALDQTLLAQSQAHGVLFANMVSDAQRLNQAGQAAVLKSAAEMIGVPPETLAAPMRHRT